MKLSNSFIAVKKISSAVPRSNFSEDNLNLAAQLILKAEGVINPLVLRRTSLQSYEIVEGHFEYYAAVRVKEIDSQKGEYIGAFIIEPDNEEVIEQQVKLLRQQVTNDQEKEPKIETSSQENIKIPGNMDESVQIAQLFKRIEQIDNQQRSTQNTLEKVTDKVEQIADALKNMETRESKQTDVDNKLIKQITDAVQTIIEEIINKPKEIKSLNSMRKDQLQSLAKERGIKVTSRMTKGAIIKALEQVGKS